MRTITHQDTENALYWLLALVTQYDRDHWPCPLTERKIYADVRFFLSNAGFDPSRDQEAIQQLRDRVEQRGDTLSFTPDLG